MNMQNAFINAHKQIKAAKLIGHAYLLLITAAAVYLRIWFVWPCHGAGV